MSFILSSAFFGSTFRSKFGSLMAVREWYLFKSLANIFAAICERRFVGAFFFFLLGRILTEHRSEEGSESRGQEAKERLEKFLFIFLIYYLSFLSLPPFHAHLHLSLFFFLLVLLTCQTAFTL